MTMKYKLKVITGYGDRYKIVDADEAHKVFYLFLHPTERAILADGQPLRGQDIQDIVPAWNETMGWNPKHKLDTEDWNEIRREGVDVVFERKILPTARQIALSCAPAQLNTPMRKLVRGNKQLPANT